MGRQKRNRLVEAIFLGEMNRQLRASDLEQAIDKPAGKPPTQAELDKLPTNSIGTCEWCHFHGPGPRHTCSAATPPRSAPTAQPKGGG